MRLLAGQDSTHVWLWLPNALMVTARPSPPVRTTKCHNPFSDSDRHASAMRFSR